MSNDTATNDTLTSFAEPSIGIAEKYIIPVIFGLTCLVGLVGNTLVIFVVLKERKMKTTTNLFILNLSIADFLFLVLSVPFTAVSYALPSWPFGSVMCKIANYLQFVNLYASVYTLMVMSFDRYLAVVYPIRSMKIRSVRNATAVVITMWGVVIVMLSPILTKYTTFAFKRPVRKNLSVLYTNLHSGGVQVFLGNVKQKKKVTKMVVFVVVIFGICWMPAQVIILSLTLGGVGFDRALQIILWVSNIMSYAISCVNPIIYAFLSDNFRKSFQKVFHCYFGRLRLNSTEPTAETQITPRAHRQQVHDLIKIVLTSTRLMNQLFNAVRGRSDNRNQKVLSFIIYI
ncbi:allatostatin-A receptor-like [Ptychodera flava]|uniref:allatostatin-A receptor-like n=1 Tax=Ptychodera flava TaxID=63121 RepID=UPI003969E49F